jgi:hypothetical protein
MTTMAEKTLRAFLAEKTDGIDEKVFSAVNAAVRFEKGEGTEAGETRTVKIIEDTDGSIMADSFKLYNLMRVSFHDLSGFLLKETTIFLTEDVKIKVIMSLLNLVFEFVPKLKHRFNDQDAKVLYAIWQMGNVPFTVEQVTEKYGENFDPAIDPEKVSRSLKSLYQLKVLKYQGGDQYIARERMIYEKR